MMYFSVFTSFETVIFTRPSCLLMSQPEHDRLARDDFPLKSKSRFRYRLTSRPIGDSRKKREGKVDCWNKPSWYVLMCAEVC